MGEAGGGGLGGDLGAGTSATPETPPWPRPPVTDPAWADYRLQRIGFIWALHAFAGLSIDGKPLAPILLAPMFALAVRPMTPLLPTAVGLRMRLIEGLSYLEAMVAVATLLAHGAAVPPLRGVIALLSTASMLAAASVLAALTTGTPFRHRWVRIQWVLSGGLALLAVATILGATQMSSSTSPWDSTPGAVEAVGLAALLGFWLVPSILVVIAWQKTRAWVAMWARWSREARA